MESSSGLSGVLPKITIAERGHPATSPTRLLARWSAHAHVRQDIRRRAWIALSDTTAALLTAVLFALVMDTLPLRIALVVPLAWILCAWAVGAYHHRRLKAHFVDVPRLAMTAICLWAGAGLLAELGPIRGSRALVLVLVPITAMVVISARAILLPLTHRWRPLAVAPVVAVGAAESVRSFASSARSAGAPLVAAACLTDLGKSSAQDDLGPTMMHPLSSLSTVAQDSGADTVVVLDALPPEQLRRVCWQLERLGVGLAVTPFWQVSPHRVITRTVGDTTVVEVSPPRFSGGRLLVRSVVDRTLALLGLVALSPLFAVVMVLIKLDSRGPVFFRQQRTGRDGKRFGLWKFRTMVPEAEELKKQLAATNQYREGTLFKMAHDPRVTRIGRWLRRTSLDELPQLLNVVTGQMALVGPRPTSTPPTQMPDDYRRRMLVKPGLTGLWQVSGRSNLSWNESVRLDLHYVENHSFEMDLDILRRTVPAVLKRDGAY